MLHWWWPPPEFEFRGDPATDQGLIGRLRSRLRRRPVWSRVGFRFNRRNKQRNRDLKHKPFAAVRERSAATWRRPTTLSVEYLAERETTRCWSSSSRCWVLKFKRVDSVSPPKRQSWLGPTRFVILPNIFPTHSKAEQFKKLIYQTPVNFFTKQIIS